jgi:hypothetical protein
MKINPSINISIGDYGEKYLTSFLDYFNEREHDLIEFASFYNIKHLEKEVSIVSDKDDYSEVIPISPVSNLEDLREQLNKHENASRFQEFINASYIQKVNLFHLIVHLGNVQINFDIINFNIIISGFEEYNSILLEALVNNIKKLNDDRLISSISVKLFVVLPKNDQLLNRKEQVNSYQLLRRVRALREESSDILSNIIFIDDRNTNAIFLGINKKSIGFILNEFITYLMTNHYKMIGNLMNSEFISMGLGTLYFDHSYFKTFFRHKIISKQISNEGFNLNIPSDISSINEISNIIKPFITLGKDANNILDEINTKISKVENKKNSLLEYKYTLAAILGRYSDLPSSGKTKNTDKISFYDLIFSFISDFLSLTENESPLNIIAHKCLLDDIIELENEFDSLSKKNTTGIYDIRIGDIQNEITNKSELANKQSRIIEKALSDFRGLNYQEKIANEIIPEFEEKIKELRLKLNVIQSKKISFIQILINFISGKSEKKDEIASYNNQINVLKNQKQQISSLYEATRKKTQPLYTFLEKLEKKYTILSDSINEFKIIGDKFKTDFNKTNLLGYIFVRNIIDKNILENYFERHQIDLLAPIHSLSNEVSKLYSEEKPASKFSNYIYSKIDDKIESIIDFNILNYLNGDYNALKLFVQSDLKDIILDLMNLSLPFINTDYAHDTNNSHVMKLHNSSDNNLVEKLNDNLSRLFTASIPQEINTQNTHKFSIIKVDLIKDFDHMVKYNLFKNTDLENEDDMSTINLK